MHALDCSVPPAHTWQNKIGKELFHHTKKVVRRPDPVVNCVGTNIVS
jgi:hypothetical protein